MKSIKCFSLDCILCYLHCTRPLHYFITFSVFFFHKSIFHFLPGPQPWWLCGEDIWTAGLRWWRIVEACGRCDPSHHATHLRSGQRQPPHRGLHLDRRVPLSLGQTRHCPGRVFLSLGPCDWPFWRARGDHGLAQSQASIFPDERRLPMRLSARGNDDECTAEQHRHHRPTARSTARRCVLGYGKRSRCDFNLTSSTIFGKIFSYKECLWAQFASLMWLLEYECY